MSAPFRDEFSAVAASYAVYRPRYPAALFAHVAACAPRLTRAWDCATGNGQAALGLAGHFGCVVATDASDAQIAAAFAHPRIEYRVAPAHASGLPEAWADVITVAQALHWLDLDAFYAEATRVLARDGVLAVWCYALPRITPAVDAVVEAYYAVTCAPYWAAARRHVDAAYRTLPFPFDEAPSPPFEAAAEWVLADVYGYLRTWSATRRLVAEQGERPLADVADRLRAVWGSESTRRLVRWPVAMRLGRVVRGG